MTPHVALGVVIVFCYVANLGSMGLELQLRETLASLRSARLVSLTFVLSWIVGPACAWLITRILPMAEPYADGLLIIGPAPTATP